jgi:hypothetical protein
VNITPRKRLTKVVHSDDDTQATEKVNAPISPVSSKSKIVHSVQIDDDKSSKKEETIGMEVEGNKSSKRSLKDESEDDFDFDDSEEVKQTDIANKSTDNEDDVEFLNRSYMDIVPNESEKSSTKSSTAESKKKVDVYAYDSPDEMKENYGTPRRSPRLVSSPLTTMHQLMLYS